MTLLKPEKERPTSSAPGPAKRNLRLFNVIGKKRPRGQTVLTIAIVAALVYLVGGPLVMLFGSTFQHSDFGLPFSSQSHWTFDNISKVFGDGTTYSILGTTLEFALGSLAIAFLISLAFSWLIERTNLPGRNLMFVLVVAPSGIPLLITSISWSLLLNPTNGVINQALNDVLGFKINVYSMLGMVFVQAFGMVPLTFLLITGSLRSMNGSLEDAADASGANRLTILRRITIPLMTPALLGALIYEFVNSVENVDVPLVLGLPGHVHVLSTVIYNGTHPPTGLPDYGLSGTYGLFLMVLALGPLVVYDRAIGSHGKYATVTGRIHRPKIIDLGRWRWPIFAGASIYVIISFITPLLILLWASIQPVYTGISRAAWHRITFSQWTGIWSTGSVSQAIKNTLILGVSVAAGTMVLSVLIAWIIVRSRSRFVWLLDLLSFIPHAIPGVVIGLSVLLLYLILPLPVYGSIWIVVIAQITLFVSLGTRLMGSAIAQLQVVLEDAAAASGAPMRRTWVRIIVPLIRPAFVNGCLLVFMASMQNLTLPLMLASGNDNTVLSSLIWDRWNYGLPTQAAVLSLVMTIITVTLATLLRGGGASRATAAL